MKDLNQGKEEEDISLDAATTHILEECRMVLPGIQALFGFQLIAVFNEGFSQKLSPGEQVLHFISIILVTISAALLMSPAALHRQINPHAVSRRFIQTASNLLLISLFPLAVGISLDLFLIGRIILKNAFWASSIASGIFLLFLFLWMGLPCIERKKQSRSEESPLKNSKS